MPVHQPVHQGVHQPYAKAVPGGHLFINTLCYINKVSTSHPVHYLALPPSGHPSGHLKPLENRHFSPLSTIFSLFIKKRIIESMVKGYAREGGHGGQAHPSPALTPAIDDQPLDQPGARAGLRVNQGKSGGGQRDG